MSEENQVTVELLLVHETENAYQVENPNAHKLWIPKSQADELKRFNDGLETIVVMDVPEWLAEENELIDE